MFQTGKAVKTLFIGSGSFAATILQGLLGQKFLNLVGVVTQADKPAGRKQQLAMPPVKELLNRQNLPVRLFQPLKIAEEVDEILQQTQPELIIVSDYGQILPRSIIDYPKFKCLNVHGSLLPDLRGAVPIPMAILKGYSKTGVSIPIMTEGMDNGPLLASAEIAISAHDTTLTLKSRMAELGSKLLLETIPLWLAGQITPQAQDETKATYTYKEDLAKAKAEIKFDTPVEVAERMVRAFNPWPLAWCKIDYQGELKRLIIYEAKLTDSNPQHEKQIKLLIVNQKLFLQLEHGLLKLDRLQLEGKQVNEAEKYFYLVSDSVATR